MFSNYQSYYVGLWDTSFWDKPTWRLFTGGMCTRMVRSFCCWMVTVRPSTSPWFSASAFSSELYASTSSFSLAWSQNSKDTPWAFQLLEEKSFRNAFLVIWSNHIHMLFAPYGVSTTWNLLLLFFAIFLVTRSSWAPTYRQVEEAQKTPEGPEGREVPMASGSRQMYTAMETVQRVAPAHGESNQPRFSAEQKWDPQDFGGSLPEQGQKLPGQYSIPVLTLGGRRRTA